MSVERKKEKTEKEPRKVKEKMSEKYVVINHDAFARFSTVREIDRTKGKTCAWCGNTNRFGHVFMYGTYQDDSRMKYISWETKRFCCKECHDIYNS